MNNYQIYEEIGHGRNSVVRKGRRKNTIEYYAIASYDKGQRARVNTSVQFLRTLSHPNVLKFYNWYETGNHLWVITELCTGGNLRTILTEEAKLPETSIRVLASDIAKGLSYLHSRGVLYVELKPSNLLLDATGQLRFYDFGLSIVFSHADKAGRVGAPSFMAPERFEEGAVPSMASDLWSFGCVLYEMATGRPPFDGASTKELISNIVSTPHVSLSPSEGFSGSFSRLVDKLLKKDPSQRATWADVVSSNVFAEFVAPTQFPKQPHFEAYLQRRNPQVDEGGEPVRDTVSRETRRREHDVLRASINAERNLNRTKGIRTDQSSSYADRLATSDHSGSAVKAASSKKAAVADNKDAAAPPPAEEGAGGDEGGGASLAKKDSTVAAAAGASDKHSRPHIIETNDTLVDGKVTVKASTNKAHLDMELDFRDPDAVDDKEAAGGAAGTALMPGDQPVAPTIDDANGNLAEVPSVASPQHGAPPATPHHPQTPMDQQPQQRNGGGGGSAFAAAATAEVLAIEDLMAHPQDAHLRPLVANNRIERHVEPKVDAALLLQTTGIAAIPALQLRDMAKDKKEAFLASIYDAIAPASSSSTAAGTATPPPAAAPSVLPTADKTLLMGYFETLCSDAQVAELVANSRLMCLFAQLVSSKTLATAANTDGASGAAPPSSTAVAALNQFRLQIATVMGLLVRHSNFIDDGLHGATLIPSLLESYRLETHQRVKRKLLACIGELLFYITSRPPAQRMSWRVDGAAVSEVYISALNDTDEVLVHYASKMVENTCSVADVTAAILFKFTTQPIVNALLTRYDAFMTAPSSVAGAGTTAAGATRTNSFLEHLRVATACAALKLCLVDHSLFPVVLSWPTMEPVTFLNEVAGYTAAAGNGSGNKDTSSPNTAAAATTNASRHNPKVIQSYFTVLIALFAKTMTLNTTICGHFVKALNWAKQDANAALRDAAAAINGTSTGGGGGANGGGAAGSSSGASCSVFSVAACPTASNLFTLEAPVLGKIRQVVATLMPRLLKRAFLVHPSSPIRAKACLLLALLIIADECGITAPPSHMLLKALAAEALQQNGGGSASPPSASPRGGGVPSSSPKNGGAASSPSSSMRALLSQLSRDSADVAVQRCADAVVAVAQIATIHALTNLSIGKPLLPPPSVCDGPTTTLYLDVAYHCLSSQLCINVTNVYDQPLVLLGTLGKVHHRAASDPAHFAQQLEALLQLVEAVTSKALRMAEQQGAATALRNAQRNIPTSANGDGGGMVIVGDTQMHPSAAGVANLINGVAATPQQQQHNAITAKVREVAKILTSALLPAMLPTLEGAVTRAAATSTVNSAAAPGGVKSAGASRPPSAATLHPQPPSTSPPSTPSPNSALGGGGSGSSSSLHATAAAQQQQQASGSAAAAAALLPPQLAPSHPSEHPFIILKCVSDLLAPIMADGDVYNSGDVANALYIFGKGVVRQVPSLLALRDLQSSTTTATGNGNGVVGNGSFGGGVGDTDSPGTANAALLVSPHSPTLGVVGDGGHGATTNGAMPPTCGSMIVTMTLRVLGLLCDACPSLTNELRTSAFVDHLMPVLKRPPLEINTQVLLLLLRLLKITSDGGNGLGGGGGSVHSSTASGIGMGGAGGSSASVSGSRSSRIGAVASAHNTNTTLDLALMKHCVTKHQLLQWSMQSALKSLEDWAMLEETIAALMELVFLVVYAASQNTSSEMAMVCGHLVAGCDTTPVESLLLRICVEHPSAVAAADCASSCIFLLVGLFEEARKLLVRPRVLTQIREVLGKTCIPSSPADLTQSQQIVAGGGGGAGGGAIFPHVAAPLLQSLVVLARVAGPEQLQCDELLLILVQQVADSCPNTQISALCTELVGHLLK